MPASPAMPDPVTGGPAPALARWRLLAVAFFHILLVVPYATGALSWFYWRANFPLRPALFMGVVGTMNLLLLLPLKPAISRTTLAILLFILVELLDVAFLGRCTHEEAPGPLNIIAVLFVTLSMAAGVGVLLKYDRRPILIAAAGSFLVNGLCNIAEFLGLVHMSTVPGRAAGFLEDANGSAMAISFMLAVFLRLNTRFWLKIAAIAFAFATVALTFSRSGFLCWASVVGLFVVFNFREHFRRLVMAAGICIALGVPVVGLLAAKAATSDDVELRSRVDAIFGGEGGKMKSSERLKDVSDGWNAVLDSPVIGHGMGTGTVVWRPHNQVVSTWLNLGIGAVLWYLGILVSLLGKAILRDRYCLICVVPLVLMIPFSQILVEFTAYWYAAIVAATLTSSSPFVFTLFTRRTAAPQPHLPHAYTA